MVDEKMMDTLILWLGVPLMMLYLLYKIGALKMLDKILKKVGKKNRR